MRGSHHILLETKRIRYEFDIHRNITVIRGDSATGKTTLIGLLAEYARLGTSTGVTLQSDVTCVVFQSSSESWKQELALIENSIVFIDEDYTFIQSKEFAETIQGSTNYYVLITRRSLRELPYSIKEIYGIRTSGRFHYPEKIYHEFYPIIANDQVGDINPNRILIVEDEKAGFQFFSKVYSSGECVSANGNANILALASEMANKGGVSIIADGAAFGAYIRELLIFAEENPDVSMYFPESFEWLILKSGVVDGRNIESILENPQDFIESSSAALICTEWGFTGIHSIQSVIR